MESSEELGEIPSSFNIIEIEDESLDEKLEKIEMSENLSDNCNFQSSVSKVNLTDKNLSSRRKGQH